MGKEAKGVPLLYVTERRREAVNLKALGENKRQRRAKGRREGNGEKEE